MVSCVHVDDEFSADTHMALPAALWESPYGSWGDEPGPLSNGVCGPRYGFAIVAPAPP
jgi:hypothetical protein